MSDEILWVGRTEVEASLGRALSDDEAERLGTAVLGAQRRVAAGIGYAPYPVRTKTMSLRGNWSTRLQLPRRPVVRVERVSVEADFGSSARTGWRFAPPDELIGPWPGYWGGAEGRVEVTLDWGFVTLPPDLSALTADLAALALVSTPVVGDGLATPNNQQTEPGAAYGGAEAIYRRYGPPRNYSLAINR